MAYQKKSVGEKFLGKMARQIKGQPPKSPAKHKEPDGDECPGKMPKK